MLLLLTPPGGVECKLWVTRRLWLALLHEVGALAPEAKEDQAAAAPPAPGARAMALADAAGAHELSSVRISRNENRVRLFFDAPGQAPTLNFGPAGLAQFRRMLEVQADRAGWDSAAAMERLRAGAVASALVRRANS